MWEFPITSITGSKAQPDTNAKGLLLPVVIAGENTH